MLNKNVEYDGKNIATEKTYWEKRTKKDLKISKKSVICA